MTRITTNFGSYYVPDHHNSKRLQKAMYKYLRGYRKEHGTIDGAQFVMTPITVVHPISAVPPKWRD